MRFSGLTTITWGKTFQNASHPCQRRNKKNVLQHCFFIHKRQKQTKKPSQHTVLSGSKYWNPTAATEDSIPNFMLSVGRLRQVGEGGPKGGKSTTISKVKAWPKQCLSTMLSNRHFQRDPFPRLFPWWHEPGQDPNVFTEQYFLQTKTRHRTASKYATYQYNHVTINPSKRIWVRHRQRSVLACLEAALGS